MTRKKKGKNKPKKVHENKPFCYYCERIFDDDRTLVEHQRAKHFKCPLCRKHHLIAAALSTHMKSVHHEELRKVPNSKEGRDTIDPEVYGMHNVPEEVKTEFYRRVFGEQDNDSESEDEETIRKRLEENKAALRKLEEPALKMKRKNPEEKQLESQINRGPVGPVSFELGNPQSTKDMKTSSDITNPNVIVGSGIEFKIGI